MSASTFLLVLPWPSHHAGGVNVVVKNLARVLGHETRCRPVIGVDDWQAKRATLSVDGDLRFQFSVIAPGLMAWIKSVAALPLRLARLRSLLEREDVAVVNFHYVGCQAFGVALLKWLRLYRGRLVLSFHGEDAKQASSLLERVVIRFAARRADALVAVSQGLARRVADATGLPRDRISVIYNGVDHAIFHPAARSDSERVLAVPAPFIVSISSYIPRKNLGCLLDAFSRIANDYPELHLCIAGADGPERKILLERAQSMGFQPRVHLLVGLLSTETAHLLARSVACVQTARAEGLPLAVLEAGAVGRPVVVSNIAGHDELIVHGESGLFFRDDDSAGCAAAIRSLLTDGDRSAAMAANLHRRTLDEFTWRRCALEYLNAVALRTSDVVRTREGA